MDIRAGFLEAHNSAASIGGAYWRRAVLVTFMFEALLALVKMLWRIPPPMLLTSALSFALWSACFWSLLARRREHFTLGRISGLIGGWVALMALSLGGLYHLDRAGWIWFRVTGYNIVVPEDFSGRVNLSRSDFVSRYPFFALDPEDPAKVVLRKGTYAIPETIVVPAGLQLTIEPGTHLRMSPGRSLISYGPVLALGTETEPIVLTARNRWQKWGVLGVVNSDKSVFRNVTFEDGHWAQVNQIAFPGTLSLINTEGEVLHSRFLDSFGKDAIYGRQARVLIQDNFVRGAYKDGLDMDGGSGEISRNEFIDCGDEGIDLSGEYDLRVFGNIVLDSKGGRIAASEGLDKIRSLNTLGHSPIH